MYKIYESTISRTKPFIDTTFVGDAQILPDGTIRLPIDCIYINLINMSPFKISLSLSGGALDEYIEPNAKKENIYIGKQGGAGLTVGGNLQTAASVKVISLNVPNSVTQTMGDFTILGKKLHENWQGLLPLTSGAVAPILGGNLSSVTITGVNTWTISQDSFGNLIFLNTTTGQQVKITAADGNIFFGDIVGGAQSSLSYGKAPLDVITLATPSSGASNGVILQTWNGASIINPLSVGSTPLGPGLANFDQIGQLHDTAVSNLNTGNQESGFYHIEGVSSGVGAAYGITIPFRQHMQNIPSSVNRVDNISTNIGTASIGTITADGCALHITAAASGAFVLEGTYTTVGN